MNGIYCPVNLLRLTEPPRPIRLSRFRDTDGRERGERINGYYECPQCGLWWPCVEEPDSWVNVGRNLWNANGWWGGAVCGECDLLMVDQPDGTSECYSLKGDK